MPSIETNYFQAIKARVATLPMIATYPVKWTGETTYKPNPEQRYIRATWFPNGNNRLLIGSDDPHERLSLLQLDVMELKTQEDSVAIEIAGQVAAHFPADHKMSFNDVIARVTKAPDVRLVIPDVHKQVPVMVPIQLFA